MGSILLCSRIALGRHAGRKAFTLQTLPATEALGDEHLAKAAGFSLHAGVWAGANDRAKLERLCRYIARPAVSNERIALTECGHVRYTLKTPYRDGTTHVYFSPLDFMARLAALVPQAESQSDPISWRIRAEQQAAFASNAERARQAASDGGADPSRAASGHGLGATTQASVPD
jgi:hypothetical protein